MKSLKCIIALLFVSLPAWAQAPDEEAAAQLSAILEATRTLQADVEVLTLDQDGREIQESSARLVMQKPDHFYWEITSPYAELMLTNGQRIWRYEPDLEQVTVDYFDDDVSRTPVLLLNGNADDIASNYTISSSGMDDGTSRFLLFPKSTDSLFERLSLTFAGTALQEMQFEDSLGQKTSLTFIGLEANQDIDPETFVFDMDQAMNEFDALEVIDNTL